MMSTAEAFEKMATLGSLHQIPDSDDTVVIVGDYVVGANVCPEDKTKSAGFLVCGTSESDRFFVVVSSWDEVLDWLPRTITERLSK